MPHFSFQYPLWLITAIVAGAAIYAAILYYRSGTFSQKAKWILPTLGALRLLTITTVGFLLLGLILKNEQNQIKTPSIVLVHDNSMSVGAWANKMAPNLTSQISQLSEQLKSKYQVDEYTLGQQLLSHERDSLSYSDRSTDIAAAIERVSDLYEGDNLGAVIIASDGIYNQGKNPQYANYRHTAPIYTVALGDTTQYSDISIRQVLYNEIGYVNDKMRIKVDVHALNASAQRSQLVLQRKEGSRFVTVARQGINISSDDYFSTKEFTLDLNQPGVVQYRLSISALSDEKNTSNNVRNIYVEVLDARQQITIVANAPHPDIGAIKTLLESNKNYQVEVYYESPSASTIAKSDLIIFHSLPSATVDITSIVSQLDSKKTPRMYIAGSQLSLGTFNKIQSGISINSSSSTTSEVTAYLNDNFRSFDISDPLKERSKQYPPLRAPFGEYTSVPSLNILLYQKIGNVLTNYPLLAYHDQDGIKTAYLMGEGIWQWKHYDYARNSNFEILQELIDQSIEYSTTIEDKRKFRVTANKRMYEESEDILFRAELYNANYDLVNDPEVRISIINTKDEEFTYTFSPTDRRYRLSIGALPFDEYRYAASTIFNGETYRAEGTFTVKEVLKEIAHTKADHSVLYAIANRTGGSLYGMDSMQQLAYDLMQSSAIKPIIYTVEKSSSIMDYKWIFALLFILLIAEWFLRRYHGSL